MSLNEDHFCVDGEQFHYLKYTHNQLDRLLNELEEGELLSKEQYKQLIEEIGLDNISTFDLDYYNLKNLPTIPRTTKALTNDAGFVTKVYVDEEFNTLEEIINFEIARLDNVITELSSLNITEVLNQIQNAQDKADYIDQSIKDLNGVIFSFERSIELIKDQTNEIHIEFEALKSMQETDESRLTNIEDMMEVLASDIKLTREYYLSQQEVFLEAKKAVDDMKHAVDLVITHRELINALDSRIKILEEFKNLIDPDKVIKLSEDVQVLKDNFKELNDIYEDIDRDLLRIDAEITERLDDIDTALTLINTRIDGVFVTIKDHQEQLERHENSINNIYSNIESIFNRILNLENAVNAAESAILELQREAESNNLWHSQMDIVVSDIKQNVSNNTKDINDLKPEIPRINTRLDNIDDELEEFNNHIIEMQEDISLLENRITNLEEQALTFATKALVNSLALKAYIKEEEELITIKLTLDDEPLSSIDIPFFTKKEEEKDRIARTMSAWTNYSITATGTEQLDTTARVDEGKTDYSTTK